MRVLSLFDGISCARVAIGECEYYACEIDKYAIAVSKKNYPSIKHLGDVLTAEIPPNIDLLIGGSPCTDLSIAKKDRLGLQGERSKLFYEYVRIWKECKPKWFILENVASMSKTDKDTITSIMGVEPIMINAALVSAQNRKRYFWTNIPVKDLPEDRGILLKDILQDGIVDERMTSKGKAFCLDAGSSFEHSIEKKVRTLIYVGHIGKTKGQANRIYSAEGKSVTLSANGGGAGAKTGLYVIGREIGRRLNEEGKRDNVSPITRRIEVRKDQKSGTLTSVTKDNLVIGDEDVRKLTPIECERLQSLPDDYTAGISNTQRYKCLGNAFNVEVVKWIISFLPCK
jgi:DNA (cytosine-5)-methyltransferase 3A